PSGAALLRIDWEILVSLMCAAAAVTWIAEPSSTICSGFQPGTRTIFQPPWPSGTIWMPGASVPPITRKLTFAMPRSFSRGRRMLSARPRPRRRAVGEPALLLARRNPRDVSALTSSVVADDDAELGGQRVGEVDELHGVDDRAAQGAEVAARVRELGAAEVDARQPRLLEVDAVEPGVAEAHVLDDRAGEV